MRYLAAAPIIEELPQVGFVFIAAIEIFQPRL